MNSDKSSVSHRCPESSPHVIEDQESANCTHMQRTVYSPDRWQTIPHVDTSSTKDDYNSLAKHKKKTLVLFYLQEEVTVIYLLYRLHQIFLNDGHRMETFRLLKKHSN